jgi:hypothetical protein
MLLIEHEVKILDSRLRGSDRCFFNKLLVVYRCRGQLTLPCPYGRRDGDEAGPS